MREITVLGVEQVVDLSKLVKQPRDLPFVLNDVGRELGSDDQVNFLSVALGEVEEALNFTDPALVDAGARDPSPRLRTAEPDP